MRLRIYVAAKKLIPDGEAYKSTNGWTMARENGLTPNGNELNGKWVLRDPERHGFEIQYV
jgi:hypothetical protein